MMITSATLTATGGILATIDGAEMSVPDDMANRHRQMLAEWEAEGNVIAPPEPPPALPYQLYRSTFVERLEPDEAGLLEIALAAAEPKLRLMYGSVDYFVSDDPLFAVLHWTVALALGSEDEPDFARADELLAPMDQDRDTA